MEYVENGCIEKKYYIRNYKELKDKIIINYANKSNRTVDKNKKNLEKINQRFENQSNAIIERKEYFKNLKKAARKSAIPGVLGVSFLGSIAGLSIYLDVELSKYVVMFLPASIIWSSIDINEYVKNNRNIKVATKLEFFKENKELFKENVTYNNIEKISLKKLRKIKESLEKENELEQIDKVKVI